MDEIVQSKTSGNLHVTYGDTYYNLKGLFGTLGDTEATAITSLFIDFNGLPYRYFHLLLDKNQEWKKAYFLEFPEFRCDKHRCPFASVPREVTHENTVKIPNANF